MYIVHHPETFAKTEHNLQYFVKIIEMTEKDIVCKQNMSSLHKTIRYIDYRVK